MFRNWKHGNRILFLRDFLKERHPLWQSMFVPRQCFLDHKSQGEITEVFFVFVFSFLLSFLLVCSQSGGQWLEAVGVFR